MMNGLEKSDPVIVAGKPTNKAERSARSWRSQGWGPRGMRTGKARAQTRARRVRPALERIRQAVAVTHPRWEPHAGKPHVQVCGGREATRVPTAKKARVHRGTRRSGSVAGGGARAKSAGPNGKSGHLKLFRRSISAGERVKESLRGLGYIEGQNLTIIHRYASGQLDSLPTLAAELVASKIDVMIALGPATWAAKRATTTIPIITTFSGDPVGVGLVSNLARPGGNITGFSYMSTDLAAKRVELLSEFHASHSRFAALYNPGEPVTKLELQQTETAARALGLTLQVVPVTQTAELELAFSTAVRERWRRYRFYPRFC